MSDTRTPDQKSKTTTPHSDDVTAEATKEAKKPEIKGKRLKTGAKGGGWFSTWSTQSC